MIDKGVGKRRRSMEIDRGDDSGWALIRFKPRVIHTFSCGHIANYHEIEIKPWSQLLQIKLLQRFCFGKLETSHHKKLS